MEKNEFLREQENLRARYIKESGIIGSMWLSWIQEQDRNGNPVAEWVDIFKVISADIDEDSNICINTIELGSIIEDFTDDSITLESYRDVDPISRSGLVLSKEAGDIRIDSGDYDKLKYILYSGDSDFSPKQRFEEAVRYLDLCGFEKSIFSEIR